MAAGFEETSLHVSHETLLIGEKENLLGHPLRPGVMQRRGATLIEQFSSRLRCIEELHTGQHLTRRGCPKFNFWRTMNG